MFTKVLTTTCSGIAKIIRQLLKLKSFTLVVIKFIAVNIELISARCRLKIARSRPIPIYPRRIEIRLTSSRISEGGSSQNEIWFSRGNTMSLIRTGILPVFTTHLFASIPRIDTIPRIKIIVIKWTVMIQL